MSKITYDDKIGITPKDVHINQVWDDDMNDIKNCINEHDDRIVAVESGSSNAIQVSALWISGLSFDCTAGNFPVNNVFYSANPTTVILSASDATLDRIDLIVAKKPTLPATVGTIQVIEGDLATSELVLPRDYDRSVYYVIKSVLVKATATEPSDPGTGETTTKELVFDEDIEWSFDSNSVNIEVNTNDPFSGTKSIEGTNVVIGNEFTLTDSTTTDTASISSLSFRIKLKADFEDSYINIKWNNGVFRSGDVYSFTHGQNGFDATSLDWQLITINATEFNISGSIDSVLIIPYKTFTGFFIDTVSIQLNSTGAPTAPSPEYRLTPTSGSSVNLTKDNVIVSTYTPSSNSSIGSVLSLSSVFGVLYNMSSANTATSYTTTGTTLNAYARVLINSISEPTVTGGTKIKGSDFTSSTNMYMTVWYNGNQVEFWFEEI